MYRDIKMKIRKSAVEKGLAVDATFELTSFCNLHCSFCYVCDRENKTGREQELGTEEWLELFKEAVSRGLLFGVFTGGEVLTRKDFAELYTELYDLGVKIKVFTNGTLLNDSHIKMFQKRPPDSIDITLYGMSFKSYEKVCGNGGAYHKVMEAVKKLQKAGLPACQCRQRLTRCSISKAITSEWQSM